MSGPPLDYLKATRELFEDGKGIQNIVNVFFLFQIPTIMADSTTDLTINVLESSQFDSLYLHQSGNIEVCKLGEDPDKHLVEFPENTPLNFQFVVHWEKDGGSEKLVCEKVVRKGVFPTTERKLKEDQERTARDLEKMATALIDSNDCFATQPRFAPK